MITRNSVGALCIVGSSVAGGATHAQDYTIGVVYANLEIPFMAALQQAARLKASELGVTLIETDARDPASEVANMEQLIVQGVDCIALQTPNFESSAVLIENAVSQGVPVVAFNGPTASDSIATFVGARHEDAGAMLGQFIVETYEELGQERLTALWLRGPAGYSVDVLRYDAGMAVVEAAGIAESIDWIEQHADWSRALSQGIMENVLASNPDVRLVVASGDDMVLGALQAINDAGIPDGEIRMVGVDGLPEVLDSIAVGEVTATVFQDPYPQGAGGVEGCYLHLNGEDLPDEQFIPFVLATSDNIEEIIERSELVYVTN
jgi:ABC-type sugar transport system substrate-binding protein